MRSRSPLTAGSLRLATNQCQVRSTVYLTAPMGEATRDESTAIAQRLASVAELYVRRSGELGDRQWWCVDACDAVAAEVSAAQNISHAVPTRRWPHDGRTRI